MIIGIIKKKEQYASLQNITEDISNAIKKNYKTLEYTEDGKIDLEKIGYIYSKSDVILNTSSKCINNDKNNLKPTIFLGHAWMDHAAGMSIYKNKIYFGVNDIITFASRGARNKYRYVYGNSIESIVLPYFTNKNIKDRRISNEKIREKYNIPTDKKILLYHGRLCVEKNIIGLLEIYNRINRKDICLVVAGGYSDLYTYGFGNSLLSKDLYKLEIIKYISKYNLENVIFINDLKKEDVIEIIRISYLSLNMTNNFEEDFGMSLVESISLGVPVISSGWGGLNDTNIKSNIIETQLNEKGIVKINYIQATERIIKLLDNQKEYKKSVVESRNKYTRLFSEKAFLRNFEKILKKIKERIIIESNIKPKKWIKEIYKKSLEEKACGSIYLDNPELFNKLYKFYVKKRK